MERNKAGLPQPADDRRALLSLNIAALLFGLAGLFAKFTAVLPIMIVFSRSAIAAVTLLLVLISRRANRVVPLRINWLLLLFSGGVLAVHWYLFFLSIRISTVAVGLMTFSAFPVFVTILEPVFFRERLRMIDVLTAGLMLAGLALIVPRFDLNDRTLQGACWGTLSGLSFAVLAITNRHLVRSVSPLNLACGQNAVAACVLLPLTVGYCRWPSERDLILLLILGTVCTALSHWLFIASLRRVRAQVASIVAGLESVYGILFAMLLLREFPASRTIIGGAIILIAAGVSIAQRDRQSGV